MCNTARTKSKDLHVLERKKDWKKKIKDEITSRYALFIVHSYFPLMRTQNEMKERKKNEICSTKNLKRFFWVHDDYEFDTERKHKWFKNNEFD